MSLSHIIDVLTALVLGGSILGGGIKAVNKLTRIADAVDRLSESMEHVVTQLGDHERRIDGAEQRVTKLERRRPKQP